MNVLNILNPYLLLNKEKNCRCNVVTPNIIKENSQLD